MCPLSCACFAGELVRQTPRYIPWGDCEPPWGGGGRVGAGWSSAGVWRRRAHASGARRVHVIFGRRDMSDTPLWHCRRRPPSSAGRAQGSPTVGAAFAQQPQRARRENKEAKPNRHAKGKRARTGTRDEPLSHDFCPGRTLGLARLLARCAGMAHCYGQRTLRGNLLAPLRQRAGVCV